jgi:diguanylate cyclase (GGDEF)-like protein
MKNTADDSKEDFSYVGEIHGGFSPIKAKIGLIFNPSNWSLQARFLYATGILLAIGSITLVFVFFYYQNSILSESVNSRMTVFEQWIRDRLNTEEDILFNEVAPVATMREVATAMRAKDRDMLRAFILPYMEKVRGFSSWGDSSYYYHFHLPPAISFLRTWDLENSGADLTDIRPMVVKANQYMAPFRGVEVGPGGAVMRAIVPISDAQGHLGTVEAAASIEGMLQHLQMPAYFGMVLLVDNRFASLINANMSRPVHGKWLVGKSLHIGEEARLFEELDAGNFPPRIGDTFYRFLGIDDFQGQPIGGILLAFDSSQLIKRTVSEAMIFALAFGCGAMTLWFVLYMNVRRVRSFLARLNRILAATNAGDFSERFETEPIHCLEVLRCQNRECPVYENPSLICYMETGSEAISPVMRNTCVYLNKYHKCRFCPVYAYRHGDELVEMRNVVNTMMRIWGAFVVRVNQVIAGVLHSRETAERIPSLSHISTTLEQIAGLTTFIHDLQGVVSKDEVYGMLDNEFVKSFHLERYAIFEVDPSSATMEVVVNKFADDTILCSEAFASPGLCRAVRVSEEVCSQSNSALCPYFHVDHLKMVRCCLPMVMGGKVGGVFSFVFPRDHWQRHRVGLSVIQKYLSESAPVLSTLLLLEVTKQNALHDSLTGLCNRRFLDEYTKTYQAVALRDHRLVGFIMVDVDFFKEVNDTFGHTAGDLVLRDLGRIISSTVRKADLAVRFGGEEFLVMLHEAKAGATLEVAEKIRLAVETHEFIMPDGQAVNMTISLGVAEFPADADNFDKVIRYSDVALYQAKKLGKNRVVRFEPMMWREQQSFE